RLGLGFLVTFLAFLIQRQITAMVRDVVQVPGEAIIILVIPRRADDVFDFLPGRVAYFEVIVVRAVSAEAHIEDERGAVADDVAVIAVFDERGMAEELNTIVREREARHNRAGVDEQVIA